MNNQKLLLAFVIMLALSLPAAGQEIYKRVNEDGVTEFSDRPLANGERVEVRPNVVATSPVQRPARPAAAADGAADEPAAASAPGVMRTDNNTDYVRTRAQRDRATRAANEERREQRRSRDERDNDVETDPNPGRAIRNAVRNAPGRAR